MHEEIDRVFDETLEWKRSGGARLDVSISDSIWLGGMFEDKSHERFVAIGPDNWDCEQDRTFFKNAAEIAAFVQKLRTVSREAFGLANDAPEVG